MDKYISDCVCVCMSVLEGTFDAYHRKVCAYMLNTLSSAGVGEIHFINEVCCYHNSASSGRYCDKQQFVILCVSHENKGKYLPVFLRSLWVLLIVFEDANVL